MDENIYIEKGFADREEYLKELALEFNVDLDVVLAIADFLGPSEDFDRLMISLSDMAEALDD